jgi:hypothetical protein
MKITKLKLNDKNPRTIKDTKFTQLVASVKDFPKMMRMRPIVVDENFVILGGNMRYRACLELGMKDIPDEWVKQYTDLTDDEKQRFIIEDNVQFGDWDWDLLANEWDQNLLLDLGLDYPSFMGTDVPRPDFNDTSKDKGNVTNAKDGNWFYVEFYGDDELFGELLAGLKDVDAMASDHQIRSNVFIEAFKLWIDAKRQQDDKG